MDKINKTTEAVLSGLATNSTGSHKKPSTEGKLSDVWVLALFKKLQARYLHKWTSAIEGIEKVAMEEWGKELAGLTGEQISKGLATWQENWPPSSAEFRNACTGKGLNDFGLDYQPEYYREANIIKPEKRLSSSDRDRKRKKNLDFLKELRKSIKP